MTNTAVFSVVYSGVEPYFSEFLRSLSRQTDKDFTLFLVDNGAVGVEALLKESDINVLVMKKGGSPARLRKMGIEWVASQGAGFIIFADADDYFADNRIEVSKKTLNNYDIMFNEMVLVGTEFPEPISMLGKFLKDKTEIGKDHITNSNCMGLTNTAMRVEAVPSCVNLIPENITAFDWALFALSIHEGKRAIFTNETKTFYRQYDDNISGVQGLSEEQIMRGVQVKKDHYRLLSGVYKDYNLLAGVFEDLLIRLQNDQELKQKYCEAVKRESSAVHLWWEPIKSLKGLGL